MIRRMSVAAAAAAALAAAPVTAAAGTAPSAPTVLPAADDTTLVALCAATSIDEVDALLGDVAASDLVGVLSPLAVLTVPDDADGLTLDGDVSLDQVRADLGCDDDGDTPAPTPDEEDGEEDGEPTGTPAPTTTPPAPADNEVEDEEPAAGGGTTVIPGPVTVDLEGVELDPLADDGSVATGTQVSVVPEGSVDTGAP